MEGGAGQKKRGKLDKQNRYENQGRRAEGWEITGKGREDAWSRTGNHREGSWDRRPGRARSLGRGEQDAGLGQCSSGKPTDTGEENDTDEHTRKGVFLFTQS